MTEYFIPAGAGESEYVEKRSRFLGHVRCVESEEEARAFIAEMKKTYYDARHNCSCYILRGGVERYADDGEPQGTAGVPILDVLKNKKLFETAVAVVRYFGGIKLGAGGLVRAYSSSAAENLAAADIRSLEMCVELAIEVDYTGIDRVQKYISTHTCTPLSADYGAKVLFGVAVKKVDAEAFEKGLIDHMQGRVEIQKLGEYYSLFKLE